MGLYRDLAHANVAAHLPGLAAAVNNLAIQLAEAGRRDEALVAAEEAVTIRRDLAARNPAAYLPDLAGSVSNLANRLGDVGRRDEALVAAEEVVTIRRDLAARNPAAYRPDLAASVGNLSIRLAEENAIRIEGRTQSAPRISRCRRNENPLKAGLAQDSSVGDAVERDAAA